MSNSELKRAAAWSSAFALGASLLVGLPAANAASGDVVLAPTTGTKTAAFFTDELSLTTSISSLVTATTTAYEILNPDEQPLYFAVIPTGSETTTRAAVDVSSTTEQSARILIDAYDALGNVVDIDDAPGNAGGSSDTFLTLDIWDEGGTENFGDSTDTDEVRGEFVFDFDSYDVTRLVIRGIENVGNSSTLIVQPYLATTSNDTGLITGATGTTDRTGVVEAKDMVLGSGDVEIQVRSWVEAEATADYETVDALYASELHTVTFYDPKGTAAIPRIEKFKSSSLYLNEDDNSSQIVSASLQFSKPVNLDQVDVTEWAYAIKTAGGTELKSAAAFSPSERKIRNGYTKHDQGDRIYLALDEGAALTVADASLRVDVYHEDNSTVVAQSIGYNFPTVTEEYQIQAAVTNEGVTTQVDSDDTGFTVRAGTTALTYKAQIKSDDTTRDKTASVPVLAVVSAGAYMGGDTLTVSGLSGSLAKGQVGIVEGFTDANGEWSVTVTSSAGTKSSSYTIEFFVLTEGGSANQSNYVGTNKSSTLAAYTATYADASASTLTPSTTVASGDSVTLTFTAKDSYGVGTNLNGTKSLSVELKASDADNLDVDAAVAADGTVSFTFDNWLAAGESDILTATLYTGTSTSPTTVTSTAVALYAGSAADKINVPTTLSGNITYADFNVGTAPTTAIPGPGNSEDIEYTGTVVDANGNGIPGASVVVAADGFQLASLNPGATDKRYVDTITVTTNAAGVFQVSMWAHKTSATGHTVTVTAAGKTASTLVKTYLPNSLDGNNLSFSLEMPANVVVNQTYAIVASLTDKWGNPVQTFGTTEGLAIQGFGSVQINSTDTLTEKNFDKDGKVTVFVRSIKDIAGPGSISATLQATDYKHSAAGSQVTLTVAEIATDVETTVWDETAFASTVSSNVEVLTSAPAAAQKVNAGSFKGYVAVYAKGYEGQRLSAKVGKDWVIVPSIPAATNDLYRYVEFTGAGVDVAVRIYIDRVLVDTINLTTK